MEGLISTEVIQEIFHRFGAIGAPGTGISMARDAIDLFSPLLAITDEVVRRMPHLVEKYQGLSARDLLHVATCAEHGIGAIISTDVGFDQVRGLERIQPGDEKVLSRYQI